MHNYEDVVHRIPELLSLSGDMQTFLCKCLEEPADKRLSAEAALAEPFCVKYAAEFGADRHAELVAQWLCTVRRECQQQYASTTDDHGAYMEDQFIETMDSGEY